MFVGDQSRRGQESTSFDKYQGKKGNLLAFEIYLKQQL